jgi:hypothetical protein
MPLDFIAIDQKKFQLGQFEKLQHKLEAAARPESAFVHARERRGLVIEPHSPPSDYKHTWSWVVAWHDEGYPEMGPYRVEKPL